MTKKVALELTPGEARFLARFLDELGDRYGNDGCNDLNPEDVAMLTPDDRERMEREYSMWNTRSDEPDPEDIGFVLLSNVGWPGYYADKLRKLADDADKAGLTFI